MKKSRILIIASLSLLLAACGDEHKDKAAASAPAPAPAAAPVSTPAPKPAAEQSRESEAKPAAAKAVASAKAPAIEAAIKPEAKAPSKTPAQVKTPVDPAVKQPLPPLPPVQLDLRLPRDMVHPLDPDKPMTELEDKPLLPPMFGERTGQSPFEVGGRLISREPNERESNDDSWHSDIRGAELQFQFRN